MKAGMCTRSGRFSQRQRAVSEVSTSRCRLGLRDQPAQSVGRVHDVGIGEHQIFRRELFLGRRDALLHRPQLAGPARRSAWLSTIVRPSAPCARRRGVPYRRCRRRCRRRPAPARAPDSPGQQRRDALARCSPPRCAWHHDRDRRQGRAAARLRRRARGRARRPRARTRDTARWRAPRPASANRNHGRTKRCRRGVVQQAKSAGLRAPAADAIGRPN